MQQCRLCAECAGAVVKHAHCFACGALGVFETVRCAAAETCERRVRLCGACKTSSPRISCDRCWKCSSAGKCYICRAVPSQYHHFFRLCQSCYHRDSEAKDRNRCEYCNAKGERVHARTCSFREGACFRETVMCDACFGIHDKAVCSRCWIRDEALAQGCFKCKDKKSRPEACWGRFCKTCYSIHVPEGRTAALLEEAREYLEKESTPRIWITGDEPALQGVVTPLAASGKHRLRTYDSKATFLHPVHCRLCEWSASAGDDPAVSSGRGLAGGSLPLIR